MESSKVSPESESDSPSTRDPETHPMHAHALKARFLAGKQGCLEGTSQRGRKRGTKNALMSFVTSLEAMDLGKDTSNFLIHCATARGELEAENNSHYSIPYFWVPSWCKGGGVSSKVESVRGRFSAYRCTVITHEEDTSTIINSLLAVPSSPLITRPIYDTIRRHILTRNIGAQSELCIVEILHCDHNVEIELITRSFYAKVRGGVKRQQMRCTAFLHN